jgi:hypothetical protein
MAESRLATQHPTVQHLMGTVAPSISHGTLGLCVLVMPYGTRQGSNLHLVVALTPLVVPFYSLLTMGTQAGQSPAHTSTTGTPRSE